MEKNSKSSKKALYIILSILGVVIVALAATIVWLMLSKSSPEKKIESYINLGQEYLDDKDYESAILEFEKVLDLDSENVDAYVGLYEAYEGLEEYDKAMQICQDGYDETGSNKLKKKITYFEELLASSDVGNDVAESSIVESSVVEETNDMAAEIETVTEESEPVIEEVDASDIEVSSEVFWGEGEYDYMMYSIYTAKDKNGNEIWQYRTDYYAHSSPVSSGEMGKYKTAFYYYIQGQIIALDIFSGDVLWTTDLYDTEEIIVAQLFENNYIYAVSPVNFYKLDTSGEIIASGQDVFNNYFTAAESLISYDEDTLKYTPLDWSGEKLVYYINKNNMETKRVEKFNDDKQEWEVIKEFE